MKNEKPPYKKKSGNKRPINLKKSRKTPGPSGFIIIRLATHISLAKSNDLKKLHRLGEILEQQKEIVIQPLISSVDAEKLLAMEKKAAASEFPPLHTLTSYWRLDCRALEPRIIEELVKDLQQLSEVDLAYLEQVVLSPTVDASNDTYSERQGYLDAAEVGIDARWAWTQANGEGAGVGFIDLEQGWFLDHEDLIEKAPTLIFNDINVGVSEDRDHGTAVLAEVVGVDNDKGVVGVAPGVSSVRVVSHYDAGANSSNVAQAIIKAIDVMAPGDVLLLEAQSGLFPIEIESGVWDAIRLASAIGMIVIEPAGNGDTDLDTLPDSEGVLRFDRFDPSFPDFDSGAIMVGSCESTDPHDRYFGEGVGFASNFGFRIDCFAWGENITTAGYGNLNPDPDGVTDEKTAYTNTFGGTSGASAIIAGAALIIQGIYQARPERGRLSPVQMRALLSDPNNGTEQGPGRAGFIGIMPNLRAIIEDKLGLSPDLYLRDHVGDNGVLPSTEFISASPDIIVRPAPEADPTASFGEGSGNENSNSLGSDVVFGQDNYIYVRMRNRNTVAANNATATVYWSEVSTLVTPDMWNLIGTTAGVDVPGGDTLVVAGPIIWNKADIPAEDHYCFVGILDQARDLAPLLPPETDWNGFLALIRNHNNVTWRNFNVIDYVAAELCVHKFMIAGAPDTSRVFDLEILQRLPEKAEVVLETPLSLFASLPRDSFRKVVLDRKNQVARLTLPHLRSVPLPDVMLKENAGYRCRLVITGLEKSANGHSVAIRQIYDEQEVGRVTWLFQKRVST